MTPRFVPTIHLHTTGDQAPSTYTEALAIFAARTGLSEEDLQHLALLLLVTTLTHCDQLADLTLSLVQWQPCVDRHCQCGGAIAEIVANFELPTLLRAQ